MTRLVRPNYSHFPGSHVSVRSEFFSEPPSRRCNPGPRGGRPRGGHRRRGRSQHGDAHERHDADPDRPRHDDRRGGLPTDACRGPPYAARRLQAPRRDLPGEPLLRQSLRPLGARARQAGARARPGDRRAAEAGGAGRHAVRVPAAERREPDVAAAHAHLHHRSAPHRAEPLHEPAVLHRRLHQAGRQDLPAARGFRPVRGDEELHGCAARRLHPRPGPPLLPRAVPARRRSPGPLHDRVGCRGPDPGRLPDPQRCRSTPTCTGGPRPSTSWPTTSSRRRSAARSSTTSG